MTIPFEIKQTHNPNQVLPFEEKGPVTLATARARLAALARSNFNE